MVSKGMPTTAKHLFRAAKIVMETASGEEGADHLPLRAETLEQGKVNGEFSDIPSSWQKVMLSKKRWTETFISLNIDGAEESVGFHYFC